jgi:predicted DNA-binding protein
MADNEHRTSIRLPDELHQRVQDLADRDRRSVHAELLWLIERGADAEEGKKGRTR